MCSPLSTLLLAAVLLAIPLSRGAKILAVTPFTSPSHGIWNRVLLEALADRGHQITSLTPYPGKNRTGVRYFDVGGSYNDGDFVPFAFMSCKQHIEAYWQFVGVVEGMQIQQSAAIKQLLVEPKELDYDLIIYESCATGAIAGAFSKSKAPIVAVCAYADASWNWDSMGVENYPSAYPQSQFQFRTPMSFWERVQNFLYVYYDGYLHQNYLKSQQALAKHVYGRAAADLSDIEENFALLLMNSGPPGRELGRSLPPNVKEVGCLPCKQADGSNLPQDVKEFLDSAKNGFVYLSFGSNVKSKLLPKEVLKGIIKSLGELDVPVLWKFEAEELEGRPKNVLINKWLPQQDVLAHKNIRLFITHGGRLSTQEAGFHGVPVLVVPFFADQYANSERMAELGVGLRLNYREFDPVAFKKLIETILSDPKYLKNAKDLSKIVQDQPESALDRAVFWTEYVLRHKGAKHLRPAGRHLNWFQLHSLDVLAFLLSTILTPLLLLIYIFKKLAKPGNKKLKTG